MANIIHNRFLDLFTIKWGSEIEPYAGYPSLTNTTPAESNKLYIGEGEQYYLYPSFHPKFFYKSEEPLQNYSFIKFLVQRWPNQEKQLALRWHNAFYMMLILHWCTVGQSLKGHQTYVGIDYTQCCWHCVGALLFF